MTPRASRTWPRHAWAVVLAVVANGVLLLFLSSWDLMRERDDCPPVRAIPVQVVDLPPEEMEIAEDTPTIAPVLVERPTPPALPTPSVPRFSSVSVALEAPSEAGSDAIRIPGVETEFPDFVAEAPVIPKMVRLPPTPTVRAPRTPRKIAAGRGPILIQPPDLAGYYPRRARLRRITGKSSVRVTVNSLGRVTNVAILNSSPAGVFDQAARRVARALSFRPALRGGRAVDASVSLNMIWRLED